MKLQKSRSKAFFLVGVAFIAIVGVTNVEALSVSVKPSKPTIVSVLALKKSSKGTLDVVVSFIPGALDKKYPVLQTQVQVGTKICTANRSATRCAVKAVVAGKTYKVFARAKNKNGFSSWSFTVPFFATPGNSWSKTQSLTPEITSTVPTTIGTPNLTSLKFNIKNAVGLTLKSVLSSTGVRKNASGSNLQAVDSSGIVTDAVSAGSASISKFLIAPNDKLYVVFTSKTNVGTTSCLLAEVTKSTGDPTCIESDMQSISWDFLTGKGTNPFITQVLHRGVVILNLRSSPRDRRHH